MKNTDPAFVYKNFGVVAKVWNNLPIGGAHFPGLTEAGRPGSPDYCSSLALRPIWAMIGDLAHSSQCQISNSEKDKVKSLHGFVVRMVSTYQIKKTSTATEDMKAQAARLAFVLINVIFLLFFFFAGATAAALEEDSPVKDIAST